jgi:hypothetical protein
VNASCGCHITIGIKSVIGTSDAAATAEFVRKLAHIAHHNAWAIYAQTGTGPTVLVRETGQRPKELGGWPTR